MTSVRTAWAIRLKKVVIRSNGLGYPFEKIVIRSNGMGYPFEKGFVDSLPIPYPLPPTPFDACYAG